MRKRKICGTLAITLLVLSAPSIDARADAPCKGNWGWVSPDLLIVKFNGEANRALRNLFEADLDWIVQDQPTHELFISNWFRSLRLAFVQLGPEARRFEPIPHQAAERRLGELKAALENLYYVDRVSFNHIACPRF